MQIPLEAGIAGMDDTVHFRHAVANGRVVVTKNPHDFELLHQSNPRHAGILAIFQDNDPGRDMNYADIVKAIGNLESANVPIPEQFHVLNAWRY